MLRKVLKPTEPTIIINIPKEFINNTLELSITTINEPEKDWCSVESALKNVFQDAASIKIPKEVNIDSLINEMNNALP